MRLDEYKYASGATELRDCLDHGWWHFLAEVLPGELPLPMPNNRRVIEKMLAELPFKGFILTGGPDMGKYPERDECENAMIEFALASKLPVLGICRGAQVINIYRGGALAACVGHLATRHEVTRKDGAKVCVNSYHGNAIAAAGPGLDPWAWSFDGNVEAFASPDHLLNGVMWHPEREKEIMENDRILFQKIFGGLA